MPRLAEQSRSRPRKRKIGRPKGSKNKPKPVTIEPEVVDTVEEAVAKEDDGLLAVLAKINPAFDWHLTPENMRNAGYGLAKHLQYLKQNVHPSQIAFYLAESPHYAKYRLAERFGLLEDPIEEMDQYGTVKSKHLEVLRI